jgi:hypothetical protein
VVRKCFERNWTSDIVAIPRLLEQTDKIHRRENTVSQDKHSAYATESEAFQGAAGQRIGRNI